ncbi:hypothetical protein N7510_003448 [Penicillium lagena]|uniref:uncharacterized protein n=1 Tax=Penicillium lagena TaxID=94218 RepID=UPI00254057B1|nr:uncharacterized protein N7510_003448 [Penicillium lagena]KAJ5619464.1 hypothetical protein N7510_003448 [Penicillium lagena]
MAPNLFPQKHESSDVLQYSIYQSSIDYTVAAYGEYAASATAGNDFTRDFLAGIAAMYSTPMFENIGHKFPYEYASTILACVAVLVTAPIYLFYRNGPAIRERSPFAKQMMEVTRKRRLSQAAHDEKAGHQNTHLEDVRADVESAH